MGLLTFQMPLFKSWGTVCIERQAGKVHLWAGMCPITEVFNDYFYFLRVFFFFLKYLFIWLHWGWVAACGI